MFAWNFLGKRCFAVSAVHSIVEPSPATPDRITDSTAAFARDMRTSYRAMIPSAGAPDAVKQVLAISVGARHPDRDIPVRVYKPEGSRNEERLPTVLFVHGGGFVSGDLDTHDVLARAIANRAQALVLSIDYRLAPEFPFPAGLDDIYAVLQWAAGHLDTLGGDATRIAISGDSAGATLSAATAMLARDRGGPPLIAQWLMYPSVSNDMDTPSWDELGDTHFPTREVMRNVRHSYVPMETSPHAPLLAPIHGNHADLPPALIQVGQLDPLRDENISYASILNKAGVEASVTVYEGQSHGFIQFFKDKSNHPRGETALDDGVRFLRERFASGATQPPRR
ncbi:alpha/beta hydrolase [Burkholderia thailandensis]|uniref:alpha/beta hydrolase n=1 Tax=Burkholderia thailandensis TaxID=57975 RepID=UPI001F33D799|nr:alpha/beta hydrolase [Burkholderia thailandensis]